MWNDRVSLRSNNTCCEISCFLKTTAKKLGYQYIVGPPSDLKVGGPVSPGPHGCCAYEHEQQRLAHQDETEVQCFAVGTVNEVTQTRDRSRRDVVSAATSTTRLSLTVTTMQVMTATQTLVKSTNMPATTTNDLDVLALNDADVEAGEHDSLDVLNVDDEDLNVLNNDDDDVDGMMIFQWSVNVSSPR